VHNKCEISWDVDSSNILKLCGKITHDNYSSVKKQINKCFLDKDETFSCVFIDCSKLVEIDSSGLGVLINLYIILRHWKCSLHLQNLRGQPLELIEFLGLSNLIKGNDKCHFQSILQSG